MTMNDNWIHNWIRVFTLIVQAPRIRLGDNSREGWPSKHSRVALISVQVKSVRSLSSGRCSREDRVYQRLYQDNRMEPEAKTKTKRAVANSLWPGCIVPDEVRSRGTYELDEVTISVAVRCHRKSQSTDPPIRRP